ncbi:MAG TPA: RCC1 domain-containing protein [Polyangia bacterium]
MRWRREALNSAQRRGPSARLLLLLSLPLVVVCSGPNEGRADNDASWEVSPAVDAGVGDPPLADGAPDHPASPRFGVTAIAIGEYHLCAILDDGRVKCWGGNGLGEHGQGNQNHYDTPVFVDLGTGRKARAIAAARYATCAIVDDGGVKCWGHAVQLGLGTDVSHGSAPGQMGDKLPYLDLGAGRTAKLLAMGSGEACAVLDDDSLFCWGAQPPREVARPASPAERIVALAPLQQSVFGLRANGTLFLRNPSSGLRTPDGPMSVIGGNQRDGKAYAVVADQLWNLASSAAPLQLHHVPTALSVGASVCYLAEATARCTGSQDAWWLDTTLPTLGGWQVNLGQPVLALATAGINLHCAILVDRSAKCWGGPAPNLKLVVPPEAMVQGMSWPSIDFGPRD